MTLTSECYKRITIKAIAKRANDNKKRMSKWAYDNKGKNQNESQNIVTDSGEMTVHPDSVWAVLDQTFRNCSLKRSLDVITTH